MNEGTYPMVIHIPADFSNELKQGKALITYHINQSTPAMTKQMMEGAANTINIQINQVAFEMKKEMIQQGMAGGLSQAPIPEQVLQMISDKVNQAFGSLTFESIQGDIQKVNNNESGFPVMFLPMLIFLTTFVGSLVLSAIHFQVFNPKNNGHPKWMVFIAQQLVNVAAAGLLIPIVPFIAASLFDIPFQTDSLSAWLMLGVAFYSFTLLVQMFLHLFGLPGLGLVIILMPIQMITTGLIFPTELLPTSYLNASEYLPGTALSEGVYTMLFGGKTIASPVNSLLVMSLVFGLVSIIRLLFIKQKSIVAKN
jgi:uncharacterized phage infection (PIP) family protein YhgE